MQMVFDIPKVRTLKAQILSSVAIKWRQFKSQLTTLYIYGERKGESPCHKYTCISEEVWEQFVQTRLNEKWEVGIITLYLFQLHLMINTKSN